MGQSHRAAAHLAASTSGDTDDITLDGGRHGATELNDHSSSGGEALSDGIILHISYKAWPNEDMVGSSFRLPSVRSSTRSPRAQPARMLNQSILARNLLLLQWPQRHLADGHQPAEADDKSARSADFANMPRPVASLEVRLQNSRRLLLRNRCPPPIRARAHRPFASRLTLRSSCVARPACAHAGAYNSLVGEEDRERGCATRGRVRWHLHRDMLRALGDHPRSAGPFASSRSHQERRLPL